MVPAREIKIAYKNIVIASIITPIIIPPSIWVSINSPKSDLNKLEAEIVISENLRIFVGIAENIFKPSVLRIFFARKDMIYSEP